MIFEGIIRRITFLALSVAGVFAVIISVFYRGKGQGIEKEIKKQNEAELKAKNEQLKASVNAARSRDDVIDRLRDGKL